MKTHAIVKVIRSLIALSLGVALLLFAVVIVYQLNPFWFKTQKVAVDPEHWAPRSIQTDLPMGTEGKLIKYGYLLATETPKWMGPKVINPEHQYTGNNLSCSNCHLQAGTKAGAASWVGVTHRFPQFRNRENREGTIEDRINGCMERSMNGKALPDNSQQMRAMVAYMEWLSEDVPPVREKEYDGFPSLSIPDVAADLATGKAIYERECESCHGVEGEGVWKSDSTQGYQYPPLWGADSYNHGAGMNRLLTAARFIKGNMPLGQATQEAPKLSDEEAYHVAAYIDSFERPEKENTEEDYPDRTLKPVSTPYGPWADDFPPEQHKFGPYPPIITYYQEQYGITKNN